MKLRPRTTVVAAALAAAALLGGAVVYTAQTASSAAGRWAASSSADVSGTALMDDRGVLGQEMSMGTGMGMGRFTEDQPFDAQFIDQMVVHHEGAIRSTQAMIADSARPELRALAEDIITSQRKQLTQMRDWRARWYPDLDRTFGMGGSMMDGAGDGSMAGGMMGGSMMESMMGGSAGTERMYLQMMIVHHQLAVDMAEQAQLEATHPALKDLAAVIAEEQAAQIVQMRRYLAAPPSPAGD